MNIVLEGPDNAGKSTLAGMLSAELNIPIKHSGGPSKYKGEVNSRAKSFNLDTDRFIYDRHPCVSQNIYVQALGTGGELVTFENVTEFYRRKPILIYCRSKGNLVGHEQSEHSTLDYFKKVEESYPRLCELYDDWGLHSAHFLYRIGDNTDRLVWALKGIIGE